MIIPMLVKIDFAAITQVKSQWRGIGATLFVNWFVKPFSMALLGWVFIRHAFAPCLPAEQLDSYIAGLIRWRQPPAPRWCSSWAALGQQNGSNRHVGPSGRMGRFFYHSP
jgi:ACR3 family arsenite transporter